MSPEKEILLMQVIKLIFSNKLGELTGDLALQSEQEANLVASQLSSQGQIECYYHPADDFPLLAVPSLSYLYEHGLGLTIPGCLMVAGGLILLTTICVLDCRTPQQRFELNSTSYVAPAPKAEQPEASVAIECGKNAVGMQKMPWLALDIFIFVSWIDSIFMNKETKLWAEKRIIHSNGPVVAVRIAPTNSLGCQRDD
jgi:hypothetical protein